MKNISFSVEKGDVFGFIGPNGAGKTTTLKTILGIIEPTSGEVRIFGENPQNISVKKRIGFMPENTYLYKYLTGDEFLDYAAGFYDISKERIAERKNWVLKKVGLDDPELIFLDEPMSGLDPIGRKMIKDLLLELKKSGKAIFLNSHILPDVEAVCDKYAIIVSGKILKQGVMKELSESLENIFMQTLEGEKIDVQ